MLGIIKYLALPWLVIRDLRSELRDARDLADAWRAEAFELTAQRAALRNPPRGAGGRFVGAGK